MQNLGFLFFPSDNYQLSFSESNHGATLQAPDIWWHLLILEIDDLNYWHCWTVVDSCKFNAGDTGFSHMIFLDQEKSDASDPNRVLDRKYE
mgnify:CR=1 FL=1